MTTDRLSLWYLADPNSPRLIGELNLVMQGRGVSLRYDAAWLQEGFALSEDLPLFGHEHKPRARDRAAGALEDARPDRWGEQVIAHLIRPARLSVLEYLQYAGADRFGALGTSCSATQYIPEPCHPLPVLADLDAVHTLVERILQGLPIEDAVARRLLAPGTLGGARPKALISLDGHDWLLKFSEADSPSEPLIEHAAMTLATEAGISVALTRPVPLASGVALAVKRFDRALGKRLHVQSAQVALSACGSELSYPAMAQLLRRRAAPGEGPSQMQELFRRMVFNVLIDNTDDHEKNHAFIFTTEGYLALAPAYDVLPAGLSLNYQSLALGAEGHTSTLINALSCASSFGLSKAAAVAQVEAVVSVVSGWRAHFETMGVPPTVIDRLALAIDRDALRAQRQAFGEPPTEALDSAQDHVAH